MFLTKISEIELQFILVKILGSGILVQSPLKKDHSRIKGYLNLKGFSIRLYWFHIPFEFNSPLKTIVMINDIRI